MLSSKANAALTRVKEIEEKYKRKRREQKWNRKEDTESSISSVSLNLSENLPMQLKKPSESSPRPKLDIKMPDMRFEGHEESEELPSQEKQSEEISRAVDRVDFDAAVSSENKSPSRSVGKQESFASDIITIQENSSIESVLDDSIISSKSLSRSKTSQRRPSTVNEEFSTHEGRTKAGPKPEKGAQPDKLPDMSRKKSSPANSSVAKRPKMFEKSNETSKPRSNPRSSKNSIDGKKMEDKKAVKTPKRANSSRGSRNPSHSQSSRGDSVVDESIDTLEDGSEIISELSRIEKSIADEKTVNGSASVSNNSRHSLAENVSADISSGLRHPVGENGYANDTFEDISSSTVRSKSGSRSERRTNSRKNIDSPADNFDTGGLEISLDTKGTNNVGNVENVDMKANKRVSRRKSSLEVPSASGQESGQEERGKVSDGTRERLMMMNVIDLSVASDEKKTERTRSSSSRAKSERTKSGSTKEKGEPSKSGSLTENTESMRTSSSRGRNELMKSGPSTENGEPTKSGSSIEKSESIRSGSSSRRGERKEEESRRSVSSRKRNQRSEKDENILVESLDRQMSRNVTNVLKKMHRDAIDAVTRRHASFKTVETLYESSSGRKTEPEVMELLPRRMAIKREENHDRSSEKKTENNDREHGTDRKKRKAKATYSVETRDYAGSHKEYKDLKYDGKQNRELQKRVVELRLQQEREDLQKYLHELKDLRLGGSSSPNYFSPLEFPKIAEFMPPDPLDFESKPGDPLAALRERVSAIRLWLKDQYILYRDYCAVAQAINARYVPTTLEDTKKTIRELREKTVHIK